MYEYEMTVDNDEEDYVNVCNISFLILVRKSDKQEIVKDIDVNGAINGQRRIESSNVISLNKNDDGFYTFNNENYSMLIELVHYVNEKYPKEKVTITKNNGEQESSMVYFPDFDLEDETIKAFSNGYIKFEDDANKVNGWFDNNGKKVTISNNYIISDIKDNKIILIEDNVEDDDTMDEVTEHYYIIDMTGNLLLQTTSLWTYDDIYIYENENNKMVILDKDLHVISNEYDKIIP
mgnify:FL=1